MLLPSLIQLKSKPCNANKCTGLLTCFGNSAAHARFSAEQHSDMHFWHPTSKVLHIFPSLCKFSHVDGTVWQGFNEAFFVLTFHAFIGLCT